MVLAMAASREEGFSNPEGCSLPVASRAALSRWALVPSPARSDRWQDEADCRSPMNEVVVRHTFLSVPSTPEVTPKRRANSAPPPPDSCDREADALCALTYKPRPMERRVANDRKVDAQEEESRSESTAVPDVDSASAAPSDREEVVEHRPSYLSAVEGWPSTQGGVAEGVMDASQTQAVPRDAQGIPTSIGSMGHAQGVCKPCVFAHHSQKACANGVACPFCHFEHPPKQKRRLGRQRQA